MSRWINSKLTVFDWVGIVLYKVWLYSTEFSQIGHSRNLSQSALNQIWKYSVELTPSQIWLHWIESVLTQIWLYSTETT